MWNRVKNYVTGIARILVKTALAAIVPFIPALVTDPAGTWLIAVLTVALAVVIAAATALVSLPDVSSQGWIVAAFAKALRQFGQMIVAATASAVLLTDIDWRAVVLASAGSALTTLVIAAVEGLPGDAPVQLVQSVSTQPVTINLPAAYPAALPAEAPPGDWAAEVGSADITAAAATSSKSLKDALAEAESLGVDVSGATTADEVYQLIAATLPAPELGAGGE